MDKKTVKDMDISEFNPAYLEDDPGPSLEEINGDELPPAELTVLEGGADSDSKDGRPCFPLERGIYDTDLLQKQLAFLGIRLRYNVRAERAEWIHDKADKPQWKQLTDRASDHIFCLLYTSPSPRD